MIVLYIFIAKKKNLLRIMPLILLREISIILVFATFKLGLTIPGGLLVALSQKGNLIML